MKSYKKNCYIIYYLFYCFIIYSFIGWSLETISTSLDNGFYVSRGFLFGPFCPIYGFGTLIIIVFLWPLKHNTILLYIFSVLSLTALEYFTGIILLKIFNTTWWSYSGRAFNISGIISLNTSLIWGLLAIIILYYIHPFIDRFIKSIPLKFGIKIFYLLLFFILSNFVLSIYLALHIM
jgi:uncharacterized membrane protein